MAFSAIDLVTNPIPAEQLADLHARAGLPIKRIFNTSGERYRGVEFPKVIVHEPKERRRLWAPRLVDTRERAGAVWATDGVAGADAEPLPRYLPRL